MPDVVTVQVESRENLRPPTTTCLTLPTPTLTVEQLITLRVQHMTATQSPAVQAQAIRAAVHAFRQNLYVILVNDRRVTDLATPITLAATRRVQFWQLIPLVGG